MTVCEFEMKVLPALLRLRAFNSLHGHKYATRLSCHPFLQSHRYFHSQHPLWKIETHTLSDIGEGVKEVQIIQWFVEEGAAVEEWAPLCEVQSDKASVEITSKYTGVIKKLHYDRDAIVQVGDPMLDIEVEGEDDPTLEEPVEESKQDVSDTAQHAEDDAAPSKETESTDTVTTQPAMPGKHASLATPAVRGLLKEHGINIEDVQGTGREGRVLKDDIHKHLEQRDTHAVAKQHSKPQLESTQAETPQKLTAVQSVMFKTMTASLSIPHFLYSNQTNITSLVAMRARLNVLREKSAERKLSYLPFIIKAVSLAMNKFPLLNARLDTTTDPQKPRLLMRSNHNIGVAMDTPAGLVVPVIKSVNARSISDVAEELQRLAELGRANKFTQADLSGGTITVSNIGTIGGDVVAPVIVEGQLAILGIGKVKPVPVFADDGKSIVRADMMGMSWSADHRVVDGATMARVATVVERYLEDPSTMIVEMS